MQHLTMQAKSKWNTMDCRKTDMVLKAKWNLSLSKLQVPARPQHRTMCQQVCLIGFNS